MFIILKEDKDQIILHNIIRKEIIEEIIDIKIDAKSIILEWNKKIKNRSPDIISYDLIMLIEYVINKTKEEIKCHTKQQSLEKQEQRV